MQQVISWAGIEYHSKENCALSITEAGTEINSTITGAYNKIDYEVEYRIITNQFWETISFEISYHLNGKNGFINFSSDGNGNWFHDNQPVKEFGGCIDIDISLTPFTNSLPINRLRLATGQQEKIKVLYIDILEQETKPVYQVYKKLSGNDYKYENVPNNFEATILVDEAGLVMDYPKLFKRIPVTGSNNC